MRSSTHWLGQTVVTSVGRKWRKVINIPFPWRAGLDLTCQLECGAINSVSLHSAKTWSQTNSLGTFVTPSYLATSPVCLYCLASNTSAESATVQSQSGPISLGLSRPTWPGSNLFVSWWVFCCHREHEFNEILTPPMQDIIVLDLTRLKGFSFVCNVLAYWRHQYNYNLTPQKCIVECKLYFCWPESRLAREHSQPCIGLFRGCGFIPHLPPGYLPKPFIPRKREIDDVTRGRHVAHTTEETQ